jgi:cytochrome oxidase Cu insertion factor (SCO1/SenC/PrrC family)
MLTVWTAATLVWWGLAFPPLVNAPPPWLVNLQQVCFGTDATGYPAPYGWGALIAGPLGILGTLLAGWWQELSSALHGFSRSWRGRALMACFLAVLAGQGAWVAWRTVQAAREPSWPVTEPVAEMPPDYPRLRKPMPDFRLVDQGGRFLTPESLRGRVTVLTFAFGHCTTLCPVTLAAVAAAVERAKSLDPAVVVITLDAWRDTPRSLDRLVEKWALPAQTVLLSGPPLAVERVLDALQVARSRDVRTGDIDHVALVYVVSAQGTIEYALANPSPGWIAEALRRTAQGG